MLHLPDIAVFCKDNSLSSNVQQYLVPMLINYLGDEYAQVRKFSHSALLSLVEQGLIDSETVTEKVYPLVLHLAESVHSEDLRTESIVLMSKLAVLLGKNAVEELVLDCLFKLCVVKSINIRKACASTFGDFCTTVGRERTEELMLPKFFALCKDVAWCVRKACAENFMPVSCVVSREVRCKELSPVYLSLLSDQSRWVRMTAYQALGPFISTFAEPEKTGLYYSKDGVLTVVDVPCLQAEQKYPVQQQSNSETDSKCNGNCESSESASSDEITPSDNSRTNFSNCDSSVPSNSVEVTPSESSDVLCHVDNNCTVIQLTSSSVSKSSENLGVSYEKRRILDYCEDYSMNDLNVYENYHGFLNGEASSEERAGELSVEDMSQNSHAEPHLMNSITVNGISVSSSVKRCIPVVPCSASVNRNYLNRDSVEDEAGAEDYSDESQHSNGNVCSFDGASGDSDTSNQELNGVEDIQLPELESSIEPECSSQDCSLDESAFNHFQYWRAPLPDIDIDSVFKDLQDHSKSTHSNYFPGLEHLWELDSSGSNCYVVNNSSVSDMPQQTVSSNFNEKYFGKFGTDELSPENENDRDDFMVKMPCQRVQKRCNSSDLGFTSGSQAAQLTVHDQDIVPPELLLQYLNMIDSTWAQTIDAEIARHCAYSLPAVALTLGRRFWPCLKETFDALTSDLQGFIMMWKVRRTVASSMHQLAVILGTEITSKDLLPVFLRFINDLDEVRIGILQHMSEFLEVLKPEERKEFLPSLSKFLISNSDTDSNEKNWRFRLILAEQLASIARLYEPQDVHDHLVPLALTLIRDKIHKVRLAAVRVMAAVIKRMSQSPTPDLTKSVLSELTEKFIHAPKWLHRQLYVYICQQFIIENSLPPDQFAEDALPQLLYLCWDRIPNVRIAIARCLAAVIWPIGTFSNPDSPHRELLLQTIHTLQSDTDADVRFFANMVSTHDCSCLQQVELTNFGELPV